MARFSDEFIDRVRLANPIQDVVGERVALKRAGKSLKGLCPFHNEKTPSFHVTADKGFYHCFSCHKGGNIFQFLMDYEGLTFAEAVEQLAQRAGIALEAGGGAGGPDEHTQRRRAQKQRLYNLCQFAQQFFERHLLAGESGAAARAYVRERQISDEAVRAFRLGFAPDTWDALVSAARKAGYTDDELFSTGLAVRSDDGASLYDRFRGRLIFPIWDLAGNVIAFGGRVMGAGEPKYLNSPETPVYTKSKVLYPIHLTKRAMQQKGCAILCEGYMDAIALAQHHFTYVVASCGTALTADQAHVLRRFAAKVIVAYDGDAAGQEATLRSVGVLLEQGMDVFIAPLEGGEDPDSFLRAHGAEAFRELLDHATPFFPHMLAALKERIDVRTPHGQSELCEQVFPLIARFENALVRGGYVEELARFLGVEAARIERGLREFVQQRQSARPAREESRAAAPLPRMSSVEEHLLALALRDEHALKYAYTNLAVEFVRNESARAMLGAMYDRCARETWRGLEAFLLELTDDQAAQVTDLLSRVPEAGEQWREVLDDCIALLHNESCEHEIVRIQKELDATSDPARLQQLLRDLQLYQKKKQNRVKRLALTPAQ